MDAIICTAVRWSSQQTPGIDTSSRANPAMCSSTSSSMVERTSSKSAVTRFNRVAESVVPSLKRARPTAEAVAFRPMILKESSAAFNCASGSSRSKSDDRASLSSHSSQAVSWRRSWRDTHGYQGISTVVVCLAVTAMPVLIGLNNTTVLSA